VFLVFFVVKNGVMFLTTDHSGVTEKMTGYAAGDARTSTPNMPLIRDGTGWGIKGRLS
jgi:hypothetical protein